MTRALRRWVFLVGVLALGLSLAPATSASASSTTSRLHQWAHKYSGKITVLEDELSAFNALPKSSTSAQKSAACQQISSTSLIDVHVPNVPSSKGEADWRSGLQNLYQGAQDCVQLFAGKTLYVNVVGADFTKGHSSLEALARALSQSPKVADKKKKKKSKKKVKAPHHPSAPAGLGVPTTTEPIPHATPTTAITPATSPVKQPVIPPGGKTTFGDGNWHIGSTSSDIAPGTYRTDGGSGCSWIREGAGTASSPNGGTGNTLANGSTAGQVIVTVLASDTAFKTQNCGTWSPLPSSGPQRSSFSDGIYAVGIDIAPGTYTTSGGSNCYWERVSNFTGAGGSVIQNGLEPGSVTVTIASTDKGFVTQGCGTWKQGS